MNSLSRVKSFCQPSIIFSSFFTSFPVTCGMFLNSWSGTVASIPPRSNSLFLIHWRSSSSCSACICPPDHLGIHHPDNHDHRIQLIEGAVGLNSETVLQYLRPALFFPRPRFSCRPS